MEDLSLHILDIVENSLEAEAKTVNIRLEENDEKDVLILEIEDDGRGMDKKMVAGALDPFVTTRTTRRVGLGLPFLAEAARSASGELTIRSQPGKGTKVRATFRLHHIDIKPLGDIAQTMITLIVGYPEVDFLYSHRVNRSRYIFNTRDFRKQLDGIPIHTPQITAFIRKNIKDGIDQLRRKN